VIPKDKGVKHREDKLVRQMNETKSQLVTLLTLRNHQRFLLELVLMIEFLLLDATIITMAFETCPYLLYARFESVGLCSWLRWQLWVQPTETNHASLEGGNKFN